MRRLTQELELKQHALALLQERIAGSESAQLAEAVAALEADLAAAKAAAAAAKERKAQMAASAKVATSPKDRCQDRLVLQWKLRHRCLTCLIVSEHARLVGANICHCLGACLVPHMC